MLSLFYLSLLGKTTVEAAKHLRRWEFGPLIGSGRAPAEKTLRRKLAALVGQSQALHFGQLLTKRWIDQALVATAYANDAELVSPNRGLTKGRGAITTLWEDDFRAFPDAKGSVESQAISGQTVFVEYGLTGTNAGPLTMADGSSVPATGERVSIRALQSPMCRAT